MRILTGLFSFVLFSSGLTAFGESTGIEGKLAIPRGRAQLENEKGQKVEFLNNEKVILNGAEKGLWLSSTVKLTGAYTSISFSVPKRAFDSDSTFTLTRDGSTATPLASAIVSEKGKVWEEEGDSECRTDRDCNMEICTARDQNNFCTVTVPIYIKCLGTQKAVYQKTMYYDRYHLTLGDDAEFIGEPVERVTSRVLRPLTKCD